MKFLLFLLTSCIYAESITIGQKLATHYPCRSKEENRTTYYPYLNGNTYRSIANWQIDETTQPVITEEIKKGDIFYVKSWMIHAFFNEIFPRIKVPFILIQADGDPPGFNDRHIELQESPYLKLWASVNCKRPFHKKAIPLPIGLPPFCDPPRSKLETYIEIANQKIEKDKFCLINFSKSSHPRRPVVWDIMKQKPFASFCPKMPNDDFLKELARYKFCISPRGTGMDCYRTWEALHFGTIAIVESSFLDPLFYNLPVYIVKDYQDLEKEELDQIYKEFQNRTFDLDKLYADHWLNFLLEIQQKVQNDEDIEPDVSAFKLKTYGIEPMQ